MKNPKEVLWTEKYRPKSIQDMILSDSHRTFFEKIISEQNPPNLLLLGNVGTGKTTLAKILLDSIDCDFLILNSSMDRGIDIVRDKITQFVVTRSRKKWKIVLCEEGDLMSFEAQASMRFLIEAYSSTCRFIITGNYGNKIIDAIASRCQRFEFKSLDRRIVLKFLKGILQCEGVQFTPEDLLSVVDAHYPDVRSMINMIQMNSSGGVLFIGENSTNEMDDLLSYIKQGKLSKIIPMPLDYTEAMRYLVNHLGSLTNDDQKWVDMTLIIAQSIKDSSFIPDKEINFRDCVIKIMTCLGIRVDWK